MADLGAIGRLCEYSVFVQPLPPPGPYRSYPSLAVAVTENITGTLSGVVSINTVAQAGVSVGLLHRTSMLLIARAITDGSGAYSFTQLDPTDLANYLILVLDPNADPAYNYTLARDHLTAG